MSASTSSALQESLLAQLAALPEDLALTAVGQKKAAYLAGWQKQGFSRERLVAAGQDGGHHPTPINGISTPPIGACSCWKSPAG